MPIIGITDNGAAFPRIGELRKGGEKVDEKRPGPDLTYFRFTSNMPDVHKRFYAVYDKEPRAINVLLPYATADENFAAWKEHWKAGGLQHRCDGVHVSVMLQDGKYVQPEPRTVKCLGGCKQVGRLKVVIPELGRLAYVVALTTSTWDISEIDRNLKAYEALRGSLQGIPFVLSRVPRQISTPSGKNGQRARREKWLWHLEADSQWVQAQLSVMQRSALPASQTVMLETGEIVEDGLVEPYSEEVEDVISWHDKMRTSDTLQQFVKYAYKSDSGKAAFSAESRVKDFVEYVLNGTGYSPSLNSELIKSITSYAKMYKELGTKKAAETERDNFASAIFRNEEE